MYVSICVYKRAFTAAWERANLQNCGRFVYCIENWEEFMMVIIPSSHVKKKSRMANEFRPYII